MVSVWAQRAAHAEDAVLHHHLRPLWGVPGTRLGTATWPAGPAHRSFLRWNYWWQAQLLDCLIDAFDRDPTAARRRRIAQVARGIRTRNLGSWTNDYYDDMAWLGLALHRAGTVAGVRHADVVGTLAGELVAAWSDAAGGGIPWRRADVFRNVPANGPAAILLARTGRIDRAAATVDWIDAHLRDLETGLIYDGLRPGGVLETATYTYCQGVVLGAESELATCTGEPRHRERVHRLVDAVAHHLSVDGVLPGAGGGDGGLFAGILARYLALVAVQQPDETAAAELVLASAEAAWAHRVQMDGRPRFGASWAQAAGSASELSVQLSGWMVLEAAAVLDR